MIDTAELRRLCAEATPGPWLYCPLPHDDWGTVRVSVGDMMPFVAIGRSGGVAADLDQHRRDGTDPYGANARFIAAARAALPQLLDEVERLKAEVARARAEGVIEGH